MKLLIDFQGAQTESRVRGIGRLSRSLTKALIAKAGDHEITLLLNGALNSNIEELRAEFGTILPRERILTFQTPIPVAEQAPENLWRARSAEVIRETFIAHQRPDALFITSLFEGYLDDAVTSIGVLDAPYLTGTMLHDLIPLLNPEQYLTVERARRHYLRRAQALKRSDVLLANSQSTRREALDLLNIKPDRVAVIQLGVEKHFHRIEMGPLQTEILNRRYGFNGKFILYVGAIDPRKNFSILLEAFSMLPSKVREAHCLAIAGSLAEDERRQVRVVGARYGVGGHELVFCGYVNDDDLVQLYNSCALFVFPSKHEGFGLPVVEALACGAPTLVADSTSLPEIVTRKDLLFDPNKASDLSDKMQFILSNSDFRKAAQSWGLNRAANFTWESCAESALQALDAAHKSRRASNGSPKNYAPLYRKRMAFFSPLPRDRSGIADYSVALIKELSRFYEIECIIHPDTEVADEWIISNFVIRDIGWFERNYSSYDRIVYAVGNSHFHSHMLGLISKFPGIVILHDFFLSDLIDWMVNTGLLPPETFAQEIYRTHGLTGLLESRTQGRLAAIDHFACNDIVFRNATGIIVHSHYAVDQARQLFGNRIAAEMAVIPLLHTMPRLTSRALARARLGIPLCDFVVCSFGIITKRKCSQILAEAWISSPLGQREDAMLVFVGDGTGSAYGQKVKDAASGHDGKGRVVVTGYASQAMYSDYLAAADLAIQLRIESRGETSGAALDCLAAGVPLIINEHGTNAELPDEVVCKLSENINASELSKKIQYFYDNRDVALALGRKGAAHIANHHHPEEIGELFRQTVEGFWQKSGMALQQTALRALTNLSAPAYPVETDFAQVAAALARNSPRPNLPQILCDVTVLADQDSKTGIQRVVRSILMMLVQSPPPGFRVEPIRIDGSNYRYARSFAGDVLGIHVPGLPDALVDYGADDIYLALDWVPDRLPQVQGWLKRFRNDGGRVVFCIYDLLPLQLPQYFPDFMGSVTQRWLDAALATSDQFVCISRSVADDVERFALALSKPGERKVAIDYFHLGNDIEASLPTRGGASDGERAVAQMRVRKSFLMVGTVEPRKGHLQVIQAFDVLWRKGIDIGLVIVGKKGWMVEVVQGVVARHPEQNKRLLWLQTASDETLDTLYAEASALIAASMGEGFGLPLIEAAKRKRPLIARDIPVFREVAGDHAFYFKGTEPNDLAAALERWLKLEALDQAPTSEKMPYLNWRESTDQLLDAIFSDNAYKAVSIE